MKTIKSWPERLFDVFNISFMVIFCLTILYPFMQRLTISLSPADEVAKLGLHLIPKKITIEAYVNIFRTQDLLSAYYWTILRCALGTVLSVIFCTSMAYPLSKKYMPWRNFWTSLVVFTMYFGGGLIPTFLLVRDLNMLNTVWALIIPGLIDSFTLIIVRNYFMSIPEELVESAKISGANDIQIFLSIILPLSMPIIATIALWSIVGQWNEWFNAMIYTTNGKIVVLQNLLRRVLAEANAMYSSSSSFSQAAIAQEGIKSESTPESVRAAVLMATTLPILCVYPFAQKYFIKGIMIGSLKG